MMQELKQRHTSNPCWMAKRHDFFSLEHNQTLFLSRFISFQHSDLVQGHVVALLVEELCYQSEGHGFES
jgi:hypothetical protein